MSMKQISTNHAIVQCTTVQKKEQLYKTQRKVWFSYCFTDEIYSGVYVFQPNWSPLPSSNYPRRLKFPFCRLRSFTIPPYQTSHVPPNPLLKIQRYSVQKTAFPRVAVQNDCLMINIWIRFGGIFLSPCTIHGFNLIVFSVTLALLNVLACSMSQHPKVL